MKVLIFIRIYSLIFLTITPFSYLQATSTGAISNPVITQKSNTAKTVQEIPSQLNSQLDIQQSYLIFISAKLELIEKNILKISQKSEFSPYMTSLISLIGIAITAWLGWRGQKNLIQHQRDLNASAERSEIDNAYMDWQFKQISEFYGPLRALLGQSNAMYRLMNHVLIAAKPQLFRLVEKAGADFDDREFQIFKNDEWIRFRTINHLDDVYDKNFGVEPYFNDVVNVGAQIAELIKNKAGYLRAEDTSLVTVIGNYLAHFSVLHRLYETRTNGGEINSIRLHQDAVFPTSMHTLVNDGFKNINAEIMLWRNKDRTTQ